MKMCLFHIDDLNEFICEIFSVMTEYSRIRSIESDLIKVELVQRMNCLAMATIFFSLLFLFPLCSDA